jgi:hypothetical protein
MAREYNFEHVRKRRQELMGKGMSDVDCALLIAEETGWDRKKIQSVITTRVWRKSIEPNPNNLTLNPHSTEYQERQELEETVLDKTRAIFAELEEEGKVLPYSKIAEMIALETDNDASEVKQTIDRLIDDRKLESLPREKIIEKRDQKVMAAYARLGDITPYRAGQVLALRKKFTDLEGEYCTARGIETIIMKQLGGGRSVYSRKASKATLKHRLRKRQVFMRAGLSDYEIAEAVARDELPKGGAEELAKRTDRIMGFYGYNVKVKKIDPNPNDELKSTRPRYDADEVVGQARHLGGQNPSLSRWQIAKKIAELNPNYKVGSVYALLNRKMPLK